MKAILFISPLLIWISLLATSLPLSNQCFAFTQHDRLGSPANTLFTSASNITVDLQASNKVIWLLPAFQYITPLTVEKEVDPTGNSFNKAIEKKDVFKPQSKPLIFIFSFFTVALLLLTFIIARLYKVIQGKTKSFAEKVSELETEVQTNKVLSALMHNIFESSLHGIIAFTSIRDKHDNIVDFRYQMVNQVAAKMIDKDLAELIDSNMLEILPGNKDSGLFDQYKDIVISGKPFHTITYYNHDDIDKWFSISAVKNDDGFVVTFSDISELKNNEKLLIKKQQELEEANFELEQFTYIASHDLQEPLRKIRAFGDRLEANSASVLDHKSKDFIARMRNASARMQILIDDLLKFSRATKGQIEMVPLDLNKVLKVVQELLSEPIKEKHAIITIAHLPYIQASESQMIQLFQNILSNALKYVKEDTVPDITISVTDTVINVHNVPTDFWQISVVDNGIGFDNTHNEKIFEIFQRLHGRSEYDGTGIGLAICLKIVNNHQGYIFAQSEPTQGTTFVIQLPKLGVLVS